jgi:hypothetical protein
MSGQIIQGVGTPRFKKGIGQFFARRDGPSEVSVVASDGVDSRWAALEAGPVAGYRRYFDFDFDAGATLPLPWGKQDTSAAGSPTTDFSADVAGGVYVMKLDTTNEVEAITLYFADQLTVNIAKKPVLRFRLKVESDVTGAGGLFAAGDKLVMGFASARNATLDNVVTNAWFMFAGANHNIYTESDDGTTDTDDQDSGVDWAENTYADFRIDCTELGAVKFFVNGVLVATRSIPLATGVVQPFFELTKAAAANKDHRLTIDYVDVQANR